MNTDRQLIDEIYGLGIRRPQNALLTLIFATFVALFAIGCQSDGPMEKAGESVDNAVEDAGDSLEEAGDKVEDTIDGNS